MNYIFHLLRRYPISVILFMVIWYLCFFTPPKTPLDNISFIDKWVHITMYGGTCSVLWLEYLHWHKKINSKKLISLAIVAPILMSGLIEILQEYCTNGRRDGDWLDFAANSVGVILATAIGLLVAKWRARR
ncbi:VanZ family protein [Xylanibacter oryzae]|uniref:VanZ family protein n=1 Tax=Xylanibacter oryzae TaxID=185293 RepID=UPI0035A82C94